MGLLLISDARRLTNPQVVEISPTGHSKTARLIAHVSLIRRGRVQLAEAASWRAAYIEEFVAFPKGQFDDQIDATTQYLTWIATNSIPEAPPQRALIAGAGSNGAPLENTSHCIVSTFPGVSLARRYR